MGRDVVKRMGSPISSSWVLVLLRHRIKSLSTAGPYYGENLVSGTTTSGATERLYPQSSSSSRPFSYATQIVASK